MGSGGHDQLAGTIIVNAVDVEQVVNRLLGQVFAGNYAAHRQFHRQILVHTLKREQVFGRMGVCQLFLSSDGFGQQTILGASAKLVDGFFVKAVDVEHFFQRYVGNLFQAGEAFIYQHLRQVFIDFQLVDEVAQDVAGFCLLLSLDVRFGHHVQGPASQLASQTHVLTTATDGLSKIVCANGDVHCMGIFVNDNCRHFCRRHCIDHELSRVIVPQDDVHTLTAQLARNCLDARTAHTDASALRINAFVLGADRDLGTRTRITGRRHYFDQAFSDFRHFDAEQLDQHFRRGTRQDQLRAAVLGADFLEQRTQTHANPESFARNDVFTSQQRLSVVAQVNDHVVAGHFLHGAGDDFTQALAVSINNLSTLGFANFLHDDLLGSLCSDTAELDGFDLFFDYITILGTRMRFCNLARPGFDSRIVQVCFFDDRPATECLVSTGVAIDFHTQIDFVLETFFGSSGQSQLQRFKNYVCRYALFIGYRLNNQQYFFAHRTPRLSQAIGSAGSASQSKLGIMLALSIKSIGNKYSWSSTCTTISCSSTPRRRPWKLRRPSKGERNLIFTWSPACKANCSSVNSGRSMP